MSMGWCHSHLVWLVFEGSIPTCGCFHSEDFFVTCRYTPSVFCSNVRAPAAQLIKASDRYFEEPFDQYFEVPDSNRCI